MSQRNVFTMLLFGVALAVSMSVARVSAEAEAKLPRPPLILHVADNTQVSAEARLMPTEGYTATAVVHFDEVAGGLVISAMSSQTTTAS
jgi:hypothetical protein